MPETDELIGFPEPPETPVPVGAVVMDTDDEIEELLAEVGGHLASEPLPDVDNDITGMEVDALHARLGSCLRVAAGIDRALGKKKHLEIADLNAVSAFHERMRRGLEKRKVWIEGEIEKCGRALRPHFPGKAKSWKTPFGDIAFRSVGGGPRVVDRKVFDEFIKTNFPNLMEEEVVQKVPLKTALPASVEALAGEMPAGVEWVDAYESFSYKLPG